MLGRIFQFNARREINEDDVETWVLDIVGEKVQPWVGGTSRGSDASDEG
jgi:hypothetical protein